MPEKKLYQYKSSKSNKSLLLQIVIRLKYGGEIVYKRKQWQPEGKRVVRISYSNISTKEDSGFGIE